MADPIVPLNKDKSVQYAARMLYDLDLPRNMPNLVYLMLLNWP